MSSSDSVDDVHRAFVRWAEETQGVVIDGVDTARFPDRGSGIKATRDISKGQRLIFVPVKALITVQSSFVKSLKLPRDCSIHGRLAAALTLTSKQGNAHYALWEKTWPSQDDIRALPLMWANSDTIWLPRPAQGRYWLVGDYDYVDAEACDTDMLRKLRTKLESDRRALRGVLGDEILNGHLYTYYWLIVNSRCFYWDYPVPTRGRKRPKRRRILPPEDCMALCPFADYFNHADEGCQFDSDATGCWVVADRDYQAGDELYVSYGNFSNDLLLVEYGFILSSNKWDVVKLDEYIVPRLDASQRQTLEEFGMLGDYSLDQNGICYRTECALRGLVMGEQKWRKFLSGDYDGELERGAVGDRLAEVAKAFNDHVEQTLKQINALNETQVKTTLVTRWSQMATLVTTARDKF